MHRGGIGVTELPFVGRDLAVRMLCGGAVQDEYLRLANSGSMSAMATQ